MALLNAAGWCDANMQRMYPLTDDATGMSVSGDFLPPSFLSDMQIILPQLSDVNSDAKFFISSIKRNDAGFTIDISYQATTGNAILCATTGSISAGITNSDDVASRTFDLISIINENETYPQLVDIEGRIIIGSCLDMQNFGNMTFTYNATKIMSVCVYQYLSALDSVTFEGPSGSYTMYKNFTIQAGDGIDFEFETDENTGERTLIIKRVNSAYEMADGVLHTVQDVVDRINTLLGHPVRQINGIPPDENGNINISGGDCLTVESQPNTLLLANPCGTPCCTEASSDDVKDKLDFLEEAQARLMECYTALNNNIIEMQSKLVTLLNQES